MYKWLWTQFYGWLLSDCARGKKEMEYFPIVFMKPTWFDEKIGKEIKLYTYVIKVCGAVYLCTHRYILIHKDHLRCIRIRISNKEVRDGDIVKRLGYIYCNPQKVALKSL